MRNYRTLDVWRRAHQLVLDTYRLSAHFPSDERYSLTAQTRRSAASVPYNICEGSGRESDTEYARFLRIAVSSANEFEYQLFLAKDLGYLDPKHYEEMADEIRQIIAMLLAICHRLTAD